MTPADDRHAIAMVHILRRHALFAKQGACAVFRALVALFDDHIALGQDILFGQTQIDHPVALHLHHQLQSIRCDALVVGCIVIAGECVVLPTLGGHGLGKLTRGEVFRLFEHQMLQKMRDARGAGGFIRRACLIPDHMHHNGGSVILDHHDLHPIVQGEIRHRFLRAGRKRRRNGKPSQQDHAPHGTLLCRLNR